MIVYGRYSPYGIQREQPLYYPPVQVDDKEPLRQVERNIYVDGTLRNSLVGAALACEVSPEVFMKFLDSHGDDFTCGRFEGGVLYGHKVEVKWLNPPKEGEKDA